MQLHNNNNNNNVANIRISNSDSIAKPVIDKVKEVVAGIDKNLIAKYRNENKWLIDESLGEKNGIIIKPSGKVYFCLSELGQGNYKVTNKAQLIGKIGGYNNQFINWPEYIFNAISLPKEINKDAPELKDELAFNLLLREEKRKGKIENFSNVNIVKSVSSNDLMAKIVTDLCDGCIDHLIKEKVERKKW